MIVLVMGVSGVGKSTVGARLASRLQWPFHDADDFHSSENVARMRRGEPLDDDARMPWLVEVHGLIAGLARGGVNAVVACSALKESYRAVLLDDVPGVYIVHLTAPAEVLRSRLAQRDNHFMPPVMIASQVAALEPPSAVLTVDATQPVEEIVNRIVRELERSATDPVPDGP